MRRGSGLTFFHRVLEQAQGLMSDEHFTVDGTLIEAWRATRVFNGNEGPRDSDGANFRS